MKHLFLTLSFLLICSTTLATPVGPMNYQGRLLNDQGVPVTGKYDFKVFIYSQITGGLITYEESQRGIQVDDGVYSFKIGTGTAQSGDWTVEMWQGAMDAGGRLNRYLEIQVSPYKAGNYETLTPRHELTSSPHAFSATLALTTNNALALGGKSATEYNNILASICMSSKGKWLELVSKCLGIGASFPGPSMVALNTLTASVDLSDLDLTKADIRGIDFGAANLTGTILKGTTLNPEGIDNVNLTNAVLDGINTAGSATFTANFSGATIKNMSLAGWSMSGANFYGLSAAYITGCPPSMPSQWTCRQQHSPSDGNYFLVGPSVNLSSSSALVIEKNDGKHLDFHKTALATSGIYLAGAKITGVTVTQTIYFATIVGVNFSNSRFVGAYIYALNVPQYGTRAIDFSNSIWENSQVWIRKDDPSDLLNFTNATFRNSKIQMPIINLTPQYEFLGFSGAVFENTTITGAGGSTLPMYGVTFNNVVLDVDANKLELIDCKIYGGFAVDNVHNTGGVSWLETSNITQARLTGRFDDWNFNENTVYHSVLDGIFSDSVWTSNEFNRTIMGNNFYNASVNYNGNYQVGGIRWEGTCPDDDMASNTGTPMNNYYCPVSW